MANIPPVPKDLFGIGNRGRWFEDVRRRLNILSTDGDVEHREDSTIHFTMLDEDDMASDSDTQTSTQQAIKAYVKSQGLSVMSEEFTTTGTVGDVQVVYCNSTTNFTITMPVIVDDRQILIKNINTGVVTIDGNGNETIGGDLTFDLYERESILLIGKGTDWT
jgi:hypothetical protein